MRTFIFIFFALNVNIAFAVEHSISLDSRYYNSSEEYYYSGLEYKLTAGSHTLSLDYNVYNDLNPLYDQLHTISGSYLYTSLSQLFGGVIASRSDEPFSDIETTTMMGFYAHSVFPAEWITSKHMNLYLGAVVSREKVFDSYVLPVLSFSRQGELLSFTIGYPVSYVSLQPHKMHTFKFSWVSEYTLGMEYIFTPTDKDTFSIEYTAKEDKYAINSVVTTSGYEEHRLVYDRDWLRGQYSHDFGWLVLKLMAGYSPRGYVYEGDSDDYDRSDARRIKTATEFGAYITFKP